MKLALCLLATITLAVCVAPVVLATGDTPADTCPAATGEGDLDAGGIAAVLATIRGVETGGNYTTRITTSSASGAYAFIDAAWAGYGGYPHAWQAPPAVQDAKAALQVRAVLDRYHDIAAIPVVWYLGHLPPAGSPEWDRIPAPQAGNRLTPRQYQQRWLTAYHHQATPDTDPASQVTTCATLIDPVTATATIDGWAAPGPAGLFATAPVDQPHHDYPAWDWSIPLGTTVYAVRGGIVVTVQTWDHNWWDFDCDRHPGSCHTCGNGITIQDTAGNRWAYCHAGTTNVTLGATVTAGTRILTSGNTGRSSGPHLHLQVRTPDGQLRCPQLLLRALQFHTPIPDPTDLPTTGCAS